MKHSIIEKYLQNIIKKRVIVVGQPDLSTASYLSATFDEVTWLTKSKINKHMFKIKPIEEAADIAIRWLTNKKRVDVVICNIHDEITNSYMLLSLWMPILRVGGTFVISGSDIESISALVDNYVKDVCFAKYEVDVFEEAGLIFIKNRK